MIRCFSSAQIRECVCVYVRGRGGSCDEDGDGGKKPWDEPDWEDRAVRMIQNCWRGKIARRVVEEKKRAQEEKERKKQEMKARATAAAGPGYVPPSLVSQGSFKKGEAFKEGSASKLKVRRGEGFFFFFF